MHAELEYGMMQTRSHLIVPYFFNLSFFFFFVFSFVVIYSHFLPLKCLSCCLVLPL